MKRPVVIRVDAVELGLLLVPAAEWLWRCRRVRAARAAAAAAASSAREAYRVAITGERM